MAAKRWLAVALALVAVQGCGDDGRNESPVAQASATTLALNPMGSASTTPVQARAPGAVPLPATADLEPGVRYEATDVTPAITFAVDSGGWRAAPAPPFKVTDLIDVGKNARPDGSGDLFIGILRITDVWTKHLVPDPVQPLERQYVVPAPADLVGFLRSIPHLQVSEATTTTVAGFPAQRVSVTVPPLGPEADGTCHGNRCVILFSLESDAGYTAVLEGETTEIWLVDATAQRFAISAAVDPSLDAATQQELIEEADGVVASIEIH
jgi:hypothetical protein